MGFSIKKLVKKVKKTVKKVTKPVAKLAKKAVKVQLDAVKLQSNVAKKALPAVAGLATGGAASGALSNQADLLGNLAPGLGDFFGSLQSTLGQVGGIVEQAKGVGAQLGLGAGSGGSSQAVPDDAGTGYGVPPGPPVNYLPWIIGGVAAVVVLVIVARR